MSIQDELAPEYMGARAIVLTLQDPNATFRAFDSIGIDIDYSAAQPEGVTLPLEMLVVSPTNENFVRRMFTRAIPTRLFFRPVEGGIHNVLLREVGHNAWRGSLVVTIEGEAI
jgi:hypothetical protein